MRDFATGATERRMCFEFNGRSSRDYHLYITGPGIYNGPEPDVTSVSIPGLNGDLIQDNAKTGLRRFNNIDITYDAYFAAGLPGKTREVKSWLYSPPGYQRLTDTYDPDFYRLAVCVQALEFDVTRNQGAKMELVFNCKPQRWSLNGDETTSFTTSGRTITNPYDFPSQPIIRVYGSSRTGTLTIGDYRVVVNTWSEEYVDLNCETQNAYNSAGFCNSDIQSDEFPLLMPGSNRVRWTGGITGVDITPRWWTL